MDGNERKLKILPLAFLRFLSSEIPWPPAFPVWPGKIIGEITVTIMIPQLRPTTNALRSRDHFHKGCERPSCDQNRSDERKRKIENYRAYPSLVTLQTRKHITHRLIWRCKVSTDWQTWFPALLSFFRWSEQKAVFTRFLPREKNNARGGEKTGEGHWQVSFPISDISRKLRFNAETFSTLQHAPFSLRCFR